jgi:hypothetical protein
MGAVSLALGLLVLLGIIAGLFWWQDLRRRPDRAVVYGMDESVEYITARLGAGEDATLTRHDVRRILEWQMQFLHRRLAEEGPEAAVVLGGTDVMGEIREQAARHGHHYPPEAVREVLELQTGYLASIGAIAEPASDDEVQEAPGDG